MDKYNVIGGSTYFFKLVFVLFNSFGENAIFSKVFDSLLFPKIVYDFNNELFLVWLNIEGLISDFLLIKFFPKSDNLFLLIFNNLFFWLVVDKVFIGFIIVA